MKISAIVCEFNPFHFGHKYLIDTVRNNGATHIIAIMSGNFTQRGEPSIISKDIKTNIAINSGIDLVIELPTVHTISTAEKFAYSGVYLADNLGCIDELSFGIEENNLDKLFKIVEFIDTSEFNNLIKKYINLGLNFPKSKNLAIEYKFGNKISDVIKFPNNILALEYLRALKNLNSDIKPFAIKRQYVNHNSMFTLKKFCSSTYIRNLIKKENYNFKNYLPEYSYDTIINEIKNKFAPANINNLERTIIYKLRNMKIQDFIKIEDVNEGLENKIFKSISKSISLDEILQNIKSKRYTMSRINRIIMSAFLGIDKDSKKYNIPYIKILGANSKGFEILKKCKKLNCCRLPIITKYSQVLKLNQYSINFFNNESFYTDIYNLMRPKILPVGLEKTFKFILKK